MGKAYVDAVALGWRLGKMFGLDGEALTDWLEIERLNTRCTRLWEANNNSEGNWPKEAYEKNDQAQDRCCAKADALAVKHGWRVDKSGGLWWTIYKGKDALR